MPAYLTETLYRFCTRDMYSFFLQNKAAYLWIARHWIEGDEDYVNLHTFRAAMTHYEQRGRAPDGIDGLLQYILHNPDEVAEFQRSEALDDDLRSLREYEPDASLDDNLLFDSLLSTTRKQWVEQSCKVAAHVAVGSMKTPDKDKVTGASAAIQWLRSEFTKDFTKDAPVVAGMLHQNIPTILKGLDDRLKDEQGDRFPIGLPHIDDCVVVGKQNLRFVGVVGMSGDGKTTLTNFITYNWLRQGARVLYISTEHSPQEIWEFMAFLHQTHPDYDFTLPSLNDWENREVTPTDQYHTNRILVDIQSRRNLPGLLDCQQLRDWDSIRDYLEANQRQNRYDMLVVDYLGRLEVAGDQRFRDAAMKTLVHDAQALTRTFDDNRGLILLTPIQVNREGNKRARNAEEGEARYDLNAISTISEYQHDLDLCLSVWSDEDMKAGDQAEIQCLKKRKGKQPPTVRMTINTNSGSFEYVGATPEIKQMWDRTAEDYAPAITTIINADEWDS